MILSFIFSWNNFIFGVVLAGRSTRTLPVAVYNVLTFEQISVVSTHLAGLDLAGRAANPCIGRERIGEESDGDVVPARGGKRADRRIGLHTRFFAFE